MINQESLGLKLEDWELDLLQLEKSKLLTKVEKLELSTEKKSMLLHNKLRD